MPDAQVVDTDGRIMGTVVNIHWQSLQSSNPKVTIKRRWFGRTVYLMIDGNPLLPFYPENNEQPGNPKEAYVDSCADPQFVAAMVSISQTEVRIEVGSTFTGQAFDIFIADATVIAEPKSLTGAINLAGQCREIVPVVFNSYPLLSVGIRHEHCPCKINDTFVAGNGIGPVYQELP